MRLPNDWSQLDYEEMLKHGAGLGYGLGPQQVIQEIFNYVRYIYNQTLNDVHVRRPIDVFVTGLGQCAYINELAGTYLELNDIRYRAISGFNPNARVAYPEGGHTAIEVFDPILKEWSYFDPYLDIYLPGISVADFPRVAEVNTFRIYRIKDERIASSLGEYLELDELFRYWYTVNYSGRTFQASVLNMLGRTDEYGMGWEIEGRPDYLPSDLFGEHRTVYVRARYVLTRGTRVRFYCDLPHYAIAKEDILVSPWAVTSIRIRPRGLLAVQQSK